MGETQDLCEVLACTPFEGFSGQVVHAARRSLLDWLGVALAGCRHPAVELLMSVLRESGGGSDATVLGCQRRLGLLEAPVVNGMMGHVLDYDDSHMQGVTFHPSSPVLPAILALAEGRQSTGREFVAAYVMGLEAGVRLGWTSPGHHRVGWHSTGTFGAVAAGVAAGRLLGLDPHRLAHAFAIAATQAAGMQQNHGTMCKSLHAGKAAANGLLAALLAERGFDSAHEVVGGDRGIARLYGDVAAPELLVEGLGQRWEIERNGHKPYACGVVLHPAIDAALQLRKSGTIDPGAVDRIDLRVHPVVLRVTGILEPSTGLESKFSFTHAVAVALLDGAAGVAQFSDSRAAAPDVVALRSKVRATADENLPEDQAEAIMIARGGRQTVFVEHATGTVDNPMADAQIEDKFMADAVPVLGLERAERAKALAWKIDSLDDVSELIRVCA